MEDRSRGQEGVRKAGGPTVTMMDGTAGGWADRTGQDREKLVRERKKCSRQTPPSSKRGQ